MHRHPFSGINSNGARTAWFVVFLLTLIGATQLMKPSNTRIVTVSDTNPTPHRMMDFEFAGTPGRAVTITRYWRMHNLFSAVAENLKFDFLFLLAYSTFLAYGCFLASRAVKQKCWRQTGMWLMYGQWVAGAFDAVENLALLKTLYATAPAAPFPQVAFVMAGLKFSLVIMGFLYLLFGALYAGWKYVTGAIAR